MLRTSRLHLIGMVLLAGAVPGRNRSQAAPKAGASASSTKPPTDIYGRDTPRGTVSVFFPQWPSAITAGPAATSKPRRTFAV
jgi:hypothetical protein